MFKHYIRIALRNILRHKLYAAINIVGLATGIACFIIIGLWVRDELSYDRHFKHADRIYRIANDLVTTGVPSPMAAADPRITEHIRQEYPEVENIVRILNVPTLLSYNDKSFYEAKTFYADTTFFDVFSYEFIEGDAHTALLSKEAVVITDHIAQKLFGSETALGKTIYINNEKQKEGRQPRLITGVIKDHQYKAHFYPNVIIAKFRYMDMFEHTYALFRHGYDPRRFTDHVWKELNDKYFREEYAGDAQALTLNLQPLTSIHLGSNLLWELEPNGSLTAVYLFSAVAFFILLIAAINYMNLATARATERGREVGIRKVSGATRRQIIVQFLTESVALTLIALLLALSMVEITLPAFNRLADKTLSLDLMNPALVATVLGLTIFTGIVSGLYPAFFISSFPPVKALKGTLEAGKNKPTLRKVLVVIQFSFSIIMLIATVIATRQLDYVKTKGLGFDKEQVLVVELGDPAMRDKTEIMKAELLKNPAITMVSATHNVPGRDMYKFYHKFETADGSLEAKLITTMLVDYDYHQLMKFKFVAGSDYTKEMVPRLDSNLFVIVNEAAVKMLGWKHPIGSKVSTGNSGGMKQGRCIGVVKDFHTASLHEEIPPMVFRLARKGFLMLSVKIAPGNVPAAIRHVEQVYKSFTSFPFEYSFLDDTFNKQYAKDERQTVIFKWFAGLCIFISCLGLMGLASFSTRQRTKEIGIRKISGASVTDIVMLLAKEFIQLVVIAFVISVPVAWYAMNRWMQNFAYHTEISWYVFALSGITAVVIALLTISIHTVRAANKDPATVLKYE